MLFPVIRNNNRNNWLDTAFNDFFETDWMPRTASTAPAVNVKESEKAFTMEVAAPGLKKEYCKVNINNEGNLVVTAAAGMQALAGFADGIGQSFFDVHVDIFQFDGEIEIPVFNLLENGLQPLDDGIFIFLGNDALFSQHRRMGNAAADIFSVHAAIELDGRIKFFYTFIRGLSKTAAP